MECFAAVKYVPSHFWMDQLTYAWELGARASGDALPDQFSWRSCLQSQIVVIWPKFGRHRCLVAPLNQIPGEVVHIGPQPPKSETDMEVGGEEDFQGLAISLDRLIGDGQQRVNLSVRIYFVAPGMFQRRGR